MQRDDLPPSTPPRQTPASRASPPGAPQAEGSRSRSVHFLEDPNDGTLDKDATYADALFRSTPVRITGLPSPAPPRRSSSRRRQQIPDSPDEEEDPFLESPTPNRRTPALPPHSTPPLPAIAPPKPRQRGQKLESTNDVYKFMIPVPAAPEVPTHYHCSFCT